MKVFLVFICLTIQFAFGQTQINDWKSKFYLEPSIAYKDEHFSEMATFYPSYVQYSEHVGFSFCLGASYKTRLLNVGAGCTFFNVGNYIDYSHSEKIYPLYDSYLSLGANVFFFSKDGLVRLEPFYRFGVIFKSMYSAEPTYSHALGGEFNVNNFRVFGFYGLTHVIMKQRPLQLLEKYAPYNYTVNFGVGYSIPLRRKD